MTNEHKPKKPFKAPPGATGAVVTTKDGAKHYVPGSGDPVQEPSCSACRFWRCCGPTGQCRAEPPAVHLPYVGNVVWPMTKPDDWCGRHEAR